MTGEGFDYSRACFKFHQPQRHRGTEGRKQKAESRRQSAARQPELVVALNRLPTAFRLLPSFFPSLAARRFLPAGAAGEAVADADDRLDCVAAGAELLAEAADVHVERGRVAVAVVAPDEVARMSPKSTERRASS